MTTPYATFSVTSLNFLNLDAPFTAFPEGQPRYSVSVPTADVPARIAELIPHNLAAAARSSMALLSLRSRNRPVVYGAMDDGSDLMRMREFCMATGHSFDTLLRGQRAEVSAVLFQKTRSRHEDADEWGLSLRGIKIDPSRVILPRWADFIEGSD